MVLLWRKPEPGRTRVLLCFFLVTHVCTRFTIHKESYKRQIYQRRNYKWPELSISKQLRVTANCRFCEVFHTYLYSFSMILQNLRLEDQYIRRETKIVSQRGCEDLWKQDSQARARIEKAAHEENEKPFEEAKQKRHEELERYQDRPTKRGGSTSPDSTRISPCNQQ